MPTPFPRQQSMPGGMISREVGKGFSQDESRRTGYLQDPGPGPPLAFTLYLHL